MNLQGQSPRTVKNRKKVATDKTNQSINNVFIWRKELILSIYPIPLDKYKYPNDLP